MRSHARALQPPSRILPALLRREVLAPLLTVLVLVATFAVQHAGSAAPTRRGVGAVPQSPAIEARYGVRVSLAGLTANRGMVDLRYVVLDPDKAAAVGHGNVRIYLVAERHQQVLSLVGVHMVHHQTPRAGTSQFMLFGNDGGALSPGDRVSVVIGSLWLRHVVVS